MGSKRKRRRRKGSQGRRRSGWMTGMRGGFKGMADSVTGNDSSDKYNKWWGRIITVLLLAAALGLVASRL